jgi:hypothetical protein
MKTKTLQLILLLFATIVMIVGTIGMNSRLNLFGSYLTPLLALVAFSLTFSYVSRFRHKVFLYLAQAILVALAVVGVIFLFVRIEKSTDMLLSSISALSLMASAIPFLTTRHKREK